MLKHDAGLNMVMVPYKQGGPAALNDVVAGHVPVTFADPSLVQGPDRRRQDPRARRVVEDAHAEPAGRSDARRIRRAGLRSGVVAHDRRAGKDAEADRR